jgi:hypothetical protein
MTMIYVTVRRREKDAIRAAEQVTEGVHRKESFALNPKATTGICAPARRLRKSSFLLSRKDLLKKEGSVIMPKRMADNIQRQWESSGHIKKTAKKRVFRIKSSCEMVACSLDDEASSTLIHSSSLSLIVQVIDTFTSADRQNVEANTSGCRTVFRQSILYTAVFILTWAFATIHRMYQQLTGQGDLFVLLLLHSFFVPLQGFLNLLVYRGMNFFRLKQRNPKMSTWKLVRLTFRWSFLGPPHWATAKTNKISSDNDEDADEAATIRSSWAGDAKTQYTASAKRHKTTGDNDEDSDEAATIRSGTTEAVSSVGVSSENVPVSTGNPAMSSSVMPVGSFGTDPIRGFDHLESPIDEAEMYVMLADIDMSYFEFPDMLTEDTVMVVTQFPTMVVGETINE